MKWLQIAGHNVVLAEKQPEYETIVARKGVTYVQHGSLLVPQPNIVAEMKPDEEELARLNDGGSLFLEFLGTGWPPAWIGTIDPKFRDEAAGSA